MDGIAHRVLGLTAIERWAATRRIDPRSTPEPWLVLVGVAVLLVLVVSLIAISFRRHQQTKGRRAERFDRETLRRRLGPRERRMLQAIALRSGLRRSDEIFRTLDAFDRGAARLLAECTQTCTPGERAALKEEVARLRGKMDLRGGSVGRGGAAPRPPSSRDIPAGKYVELTGGPAHDPVTLRAEVLRNDDMEWVVATPLPLESRPGATWLVRFWAGLPAWEFPAATLQCVGNRLTLRHSEEIRFVSGPRLPRSTVCWPALIAPFPFLQTAGHAGTAPAGESEALARTQADPAAAETAARVLRPTEPLFVEAVVTELAGPVLRIETRLPVEREDRVLVLFRAIPPAPDATGRTVAALGRVKQGRDLERGDGIPDAIDRIWDTSPARDSQTAAGRPVSIAVELTDLDDRQREELAVLTDERSARAPEADGDGSAGAQETAAYTTTAVA